MKKYYLVLLTFLILTLLFASLKVEAKKQLTGKIIVVDPGHGGIDPGTMYGEILEKNINLNISYYLKEELENLGAKVIITRNGDYDLSTPNAYQRKRSDFDNRINLINNSNADLYVSVHLNYLLDTTYYGPQVFYNKDNEKLATIIQKNMNESLKGDRKIKQIPTDTYMYSKLTIPGVLIECGFLSNNSERNLLETENYQQKIAKAISESIVKYY